MAYLILRNSLRTLAISNVWCTGNVKSRWVSLDWGDSECFSKSTGFNSCLLTFHDVIFFTSAWCCIPFSLLLLLLGKHNSNRIDAMKCSAVGFVAVVFFFFLLPVLRRDLFRYTAVCYSGSGFLQLLLKKSCLTREA